MSEIKLKLRTAAFGGFQRQDVVDYIENSTKEHTAQLNALRAELKEAGEQLAMLEGEKARADALEERCEILTRRVDELTPLAESVPELLARAEAYRPDAEAYRALRESVADIELEARTRAARVLQQAEAEAEAKRALTQNLLDRFNEEYSRMGDGAISGLNEVISRLTELRESFAARPQLQQLRKAAEEEPNHA